MMLFVGFTTATPGRETRQGNTVTSTSTAFSTSTLTVSITNTIACAQLVNVTGVCRRRRGLFYEEPIIMFFDEGLDDVEAYFNPTAPVRMETTARMALPNQLNSEPMSYPSNNVQSSKGSGAQEMPSLDPSTLIVPRIFFSQIAAIFNNIFGGGTTVTETVTDTVFDSITSTILSTATFFISKCTPSPFPYSLCARR